MGEMVRALEPHYYTDPVIFAREAERIFFRTWQYAGHVSRLERPGDYFAFDLLGQSRGREGLERRRQDLPVDRRRVSQRFANGGAGQHGRLVQHLHRVAQQDLRVQVFGVAPHRWRAQVRYGLCSAPAAHARVSVVLRLCVCCAALCTTRVVMYRMYITVDLHVHVHVHVRCTSLCMRAVNSVMNSVFISCDAVHAMYMYGMQGFVQAFMYM